MELILALYEMLDKLSNKGRGSVHDYHTKYMYMSELAASPENRSTGMEYGSNWPYHSITKARM